MSTTCVLSNAYTKNYLEVARAIGRACGLCDNLLKVVQCSALVTPASDSIFYLRSAPRFVYSTVSLSV